jgi:hypothetical protein
MRTNREKYEHYCAEIAAKDAEAIAGLFQQGVPARLYKIQNYAAAEVEVTSVGVYRRGIYKHDESDHVTKAEVELAAKHAAEWTAPTLDTILVHYREVQAYGVASGAHPFSKIAAAVDLAWQAEDLSAEIARRRELYAPRDGHTACGYCQKQRPTDKLVSKTIFYRDRGGSRTKVGQYCSDQCGYYDQCGHEG